MKTLDLKIYRCENGWITEKEDITFVHTSAESVFNYIAGSLLDDFSAEQIIEAMLKANKTRYNLKFETLKIMEKGKVSHGQKI